jgi:hypothetical protein
MALSFGVIKESDTRLPLPAFLSSATKAVATFSYDISSPPDFSGFFTFLVSTFSATDDLSLLQPLLDLLSAIAAYKLGVNVISVWSSASPFAVKLLCSTAASHVKSAVEYFRKVARAIGPRVVLADFVARNSENAAIHRGLAIIMYQLMVDNAEFRFVDSDFGEWVSPLTAVDEIGPRLIVLIRGGAPRIVRPPSVPPKAPAPPLLQLPGPHPQTPRPTNPGRIFERGNSLGQMSERQQRVRVFVDEEFAAGTHVAQVAGKVRTGLLEKDWEERSAAYNTIRRLFKYAPEAVSDDDIHTFVTAILDDIGSSQTALVLAALGAIGEAFRGKPTAMEFELGRLVPPMLPLHQKTAQFFEAALSDCFAAIVETMSVKRFLGVLVANGDARGSKVQAAIAKYCRDSLAKLGTEKLFARTSNDADDLVKLVSKLLSGAASETRAAAKDSAKALAQYYGDHFATIVQHALQPREASDLLRVV